MMDRLGMVGVQHDDGGNSNGDCHDGEADGLQDGMAQGA